jgi:hypothetical protein
MRLPALRRAAEAAGVPASVLARALGSKHPREAVVQCLAEAGRHAAAAPTGMAAIRTVYGLQDKRTAAAARAAWPHKSSDHSSGSLGAPSRPASAPPLATSDYHSGTTAAGAAAHRATRIEWGGNGRPPPARRRRRRVRHGRGVAVAGGGGRAGEPLGPPPAWVSGAEVTMNGWVEAGGAKPPARLLPHSELPPPDEPAQFTDTPAHQGAAAAGEQQGQRRHNHRAQQAARVYQMPLSKHRPHTPEALHEAKLTSPGL